MTKKKKEDSPEKVVLISDVLKVDVRSLTTQLELEKGIKVHTINKARTVTPRSKLGQELKPKVYPTEIHLVCDKKPTKNKLSKLQKIADLHSPIGRSKDDIFAEAQRLLKQLNSLRD